jgi:5-methylcytosine-specific restriction endonuclease McrBC GTP-binding regulatory subunit McrB
VPENVYIIGTMNDIDRSVESMDFAMRRRFAWSEVTAEESMNMLNGTHYENEAKRRMQKLNNAILKVRGLGEAYQIGAAYFKKIDDYGGDFQKLWDVHLKGLLYEYLRGNVNANEQLEELKKAYDN